MTIFDSIKYPLSDPPTSKELYDLPEKIIDKWIEVCGSIHAGRSSTRRFRDYPPAVATLRKIIAEYEDDNI